MWECTFSPDHGWWKWLFWFSLPTICIDCYCISWWSLFFLTTIIIIDDDDDDGSCSFGFLFAPETTPSAGAARGWPPKTSWSCAAIWRCRRLSRATSRRCGSFNMVNTHYYTWWLIPLSKCVITPVISGLTLLIPFITGVITHLLSGMSHQVYIYIYIYTWHIISHYYYIIMSLSLISW